MIFVFFFLIDFRQFDVFFATYREYFQKGWTYLSKLDSIMLEWKETARQVIISFYFIFFNLNESFLTTLEQILFK